MKQAACTTTTDEALQALRDAGLRLTQPRRQIVATLVAADTPLSPRELHQQLGSTACDPVTVYRCLTDFERLGLVHRHEFGDGSTRYQLVEADGSHQHYVICRHCQRKDPIHACPADLEAAVRARGYAGVSHTLEFFGVCPDCQQGSDQEPR